MNTRIIRVDEALKIVHKANKQVKENPGYRLGQALYNLIRDKFTHEVLVEMEDHYKWYNTLDKQFALNYFYSNFVVEISI
jgi:hypothetical protein